jgi:hypothetical protein
MGAGRIDSLDGEAAREHATTVTDADSPGPNFHSNGHSPDGKHVPDLAPDRADQKQIPRNVNKTGRQRV